MKGSRLMAAASIAVLSLSLVACAGQGSGGTAGGSPVATTQVDLPKSYKFAPAAIVVPVGATVTWKNSDNFTHSVQLDGEASPGSVMKPGETTTHTFDKAGTFTYVCAFHPQDMRGSVTVTAASGSETP
jgi:plastocyanin